MSDTEEKCIICRDKKLHFSDHCLIMGILNLTPDSFSDGGQFLEVEKAIEHAHRMVEEGADIIDVGGESSRPGSAPVSVEEELNRVLPVLERLTKELKVPISIDTYKYEVARQALDLGVDIINDITGLRGESDMAGLIARYRAGVVIMHMKGNPQTMQENPQYDDVIQEIKDFFRDRIDMAVSSGIQRQSIIVDPGIGFGKNLEHNLEIIRRLSDFKVLGLPLLVGPSRKSFIGQVLSLPVDERLEGTLAAVAVCVLKGASLVRVHDVRQTARVVRMVEAIRSKVE